MYNLYTHMVLYIVLVQYKATLVINVAAFTVRGKISSVVIAVVSYL